MALNLQDCTFYGPALPEPFVKFDLEPLLQKAKLLPRATGAEGRKLQEEWDSLRQKLRALGDQGGALRVAHHVLEPLRQRLGWADMVQQGTVATREGEEDGGFLMRTPDGRHQLRAWAVAVGTDLDAPNKRGRAYRFSPTRVAHRVMLAKGERLGLLTDSVELRLLVSDPARPDSQIVFRLDRTNGWRGVRAVPDSYRLLVALASPAGVEKLPEFTEAARHSQTKVTARLREQARAAIEGFVQEVLRQPRNAQALAERKDKSALARQLWEEGLVLVYRLLFTFKLETSPDPARSFSFASTSLWRQTYSPGLALAKHAQAVLGDGRETGRMLEDGLRAVFRLFESGLSASELRVYPLGGMLFGKGTTPLLDELTWGEKAVALLLDRLLWTPGDGKAERQRVHYGLLDVEELGRVYEALLELEPGIAEAPMCRLRRDKLEVVVPRAQRPAESGKADGGTAIEWMEDIQEGQFFLRVGLGRKSTGSYYTPHPFVRFLVQETLGPEVARCSPTEDPRPAEILKLKVLDPAMGSGHFLVEACRFLADKLYEACRLCDELAAEVEEKAEGAKSEKQKEEARTRAAELRARVALLPDPNDELLAYLPSRASEGSESGLSQSRALALCRRLVAVHCLYGVDRNPLAVELAKVSLWLESYSEGLPLTFLDHRLIHGNSLTGPLFENLLTKPGRGGDVGGLFVQRLKPRLEEALSEALEHVKDLEATIGKDVADLERKRGAKARLDAALAPFRLLAHAWTGGAMLGEESDDQAYESLLEAIADKKDADASVSSRSSLNQMVKLGSSSFAYDLEFPEVFYPKGSPRERQGFDVIVGNPPWEAIRRDDDQFFGIIDVEILNLATKNEKKKIIQKLLEKHNTKSNYQIYCESIAQQDRVFDRLFSVHKAKVKNILAGRGIYDLYMLFGERSAKLASPRHGHVGLLLPSSFHANEGSTGLRRIYVEEMNLHHCYSFENRRNLFEIDSRMKFATVVAQHGPAATQEFSCAFYLQETEWLFSERETLKYSRDFIRQTGGEYLTFLELRSAIDADSAAVCYKSGDDLSKACSLARIKLGQEVNMTYDSDLFTPTNNICTPEEDPRSPQTSLRLLKKAYLPLHEGKTFHQYDDCWEDRPRYLIEVRAVAGRSIWLQASRHYRLAFRDIARATDERTGIFCMLPPGCMFGNTAPCEREPQRRPTSAALLLLSELNSFSFDWTLRMKSGTHVNLFILGGCPLPPIQPKSAVARALAHSALRLSANHEGYRALWEEQVGQAWREPGRAAFTWPVLPDAQARWRVRAAIDALVAHAYGLSREQYRHVLSGFSHASAPEAPELCLAAFDELQALGPESFARKHDPYWDIPLNEQLPRPVLDFPGFTDDAFTSPAYEAEPEALLLAAESGEEDAAPPPPPKRRPRKKAAK